MACCRAYHQPFPGCGQILLKGVTYHVVRMIAACIGLNVPALFNKQRGIFDDKAFL
jgi:hypothetical protein